MYNDNYKKIIKIDKQLENIKKYLIKLEKKEKKRIKKSILYSKYTQFIEKYLYKYREIIQNILNKYRLLFIKIYKPLNKILKFNFLIWNKLNIIFRFLTFPFNYFWIIHYNKIKLHKNEKTPLHEPGVHLITGCMGSGKSSSVYYYITQELQKTGKGAYINTALEKASIDLDGEEYVYNRQFELEEFFKEGKQLKKFNTLKFDKIVIDEMNYYLNHRLNKTKNYNNILLPLLRQATNMRHDSIKQIIILTQQPNFDNQLMNIVSYYHRVQIKKGILYYFWLFFGVKLSKTYGVKGWKFETQYIQGGRVPENGKVKKWLLKYKNSSYILDSFDTFNMKNREETKKMETDNVNFK